MSGLFITGTDTGIGKTFVSSLIMTLLINKGFKVVGMKPVASGAEIIDGVLKNQDALDLISAANVEVDYTTVNPYVFKPAVSPHIAAGQAGIDIELQTIKKNFQLLQQKADVVVVEGVGGWYAPLSFKTTIADLAEALQLPVLLVVGMRLGCLNHALLTARAIQRSGLPIAGWVANHLEKDFMFETENMNTLQNMLSGLPFIGSVFYDLNQNLLQQNNAGCKNKKKLHELKAENLINILAMK